MILNRGASDLGLAAKKRASMAGVEVSLRPIVNLSPLDR